jgi:hypothetical protein
MSYIEIEYPFSSKPVLRELYQRFQGQSLRYGLLLEDLDALAADIAARHIGDLQGCSIVTGSVDKIAWLQPGLPHTLLNINQDVKLAGQVCVTTAHRWHDVVAQACGCDPQVTWVGRSSLEVVMEIRQRCAGNSCWEVVGDARCVPLLVLLELFPLFFNLCHWPRFAMVCRGPHGERPPSVVQLALTTPHEHERFRLGALHVQERR